MPVPRPRPLITCAAALVAALSVTGCSLTGDPVRASKTVTAPAPATPAPRLHGEAARAAAAVATLDRALGDGDVERLCRPNAIFSAAVVAEMRSGGVSCEASIEDTLANRRVPAMQVVSVAVKPDLATAQVRVGGGHTVPLSLLREGRRWVVSFSDGDDPLGALTA